MPASPSVLASLLLAPSLLITCSLLATRVPNAYMDEIFHVPQAQKYCALDFAHWDPKITTLPGAYLLAVPFSRLAGPALQWLFPAAATGGGGGGSGASDVGIASSAGAGAAACTTAVLRSLNPFLNAATTVVLYRTSLLLHGSRGHGGGPGSGSAKASARHALLISLIPVHFFFSLLFYTDSAATLFVLLSYYLSLPGPAARRRAGETGEVSLPATKAGVGFGWLLASGVAGAVAVVCRQTNVVWVVFIAGTVVVRRVENAVSLDAVYEGLGLHRGRNEGSGQARKAKKAKKAITAKGGEGTRGSALKKEKGGTAANKAGATDTEDTADAADAAGKATTYRMTSALDAPAVLVRLLQILAGRPGLLVTAVLEVLPHLVVVAGFAVFVFVNGSIVVGDKDHHKPVFHPGQVKRERRQGDGERERESGSERGGEGWRERETELFVPWGMRREKRSNEWGRKEEKRETPIVVLRCQCVV